MRTLALAAALALISSAALAQDASPDQPQASLLPPKVMSTEHPNEEAVEAYTQSNANAGATPFEGAAMYEAFHGAEGVSRIVDGFVQRNITDPRIMGQFAATDMVRLKRTPGRTVLPPDRHHLRGLWRRESTERLIPFDVIPRIIGAPEWALLEKRPEQRVSALNMPSWPTSTAARNASRPASSRPT
jgi:hypothetical protein